MITKEKERDILERARYKKAVRLKVGSIEGSSHTILYLTLMKV